MKIPTDCVCLHLRMAARAATRAYDEALAPYGLRGTQFSLLCMIQVRKSVGVSELADYAVMDRTTLTRNLRLLEKGKLISSRPGEDRRKRVITLTKVGNERLRVALPAWRKVQARMVDALGDSRKGRMIKDLRFTAGLQI